MVHKLELLRTEVRFDREKLVGLLVSKQDGRTFKPKIASKLCFHYVDKVQVRSLRADQRREPYSLKVIFHDLLSLCLSQDFSKFGLTQCSNKVQHTLLMRSKVNIEPILLLLRNDLDHRV